MQPRLAVLVDADNISVSFAPAILRLVANLGVPLVRRLYGKPGAISTWEGFAQDELYELRPQVGLTSAKNGADIALTIGAMDILHEGLADSFCIVSNDRDFVPLALRLRAVNRQVHAICSQPDERLLKAFDSVLALATSSPVVDAFHKIVAAAGKSEFGLAEAGKLLRDAAPGLVPPPGKGKLRKYLEESGAFVFSGTGAEIRVGLKAA